MFIFIPENNQLIDKISGNDRILTTETPLFTESNSLKSNFYQNLN